MKDKRKKMLTTIYWPFPVLFQLPLKKTTKESDLNLDVTIIILIRYHSKAWTGLESNF